MSKLLLQLGIDQAVFFTLLVKLWNIVAGLLTIFLVGHVLSSELQGFYYTFNSLIALQVFAELGFSLAIIQFSSHEMAHLEWSDDGTLTGNSQAKSRLVSLLRFSLIWFSVAAILLVAILLPLGFYFLTKSEMLPISSSEIIIPWSILVTFTAANLLVIACSAILEGCGKVADVALLRLWQSIAAMTLTLIILSLGGQLYALAFNGLIMFSVGFFWLKNNYWNFFKDLMMHSVSLPGINWLKEIWPFQWKIAISWMSGYLIFQLFTPLVFRTHGAVAAGQMGMSLQIMGAISGLAMSWISTKAPIYGQLIATNKWQQLDALFFKGLIQSLILIISSIAMLLAGLYYIGQLGLIFATRVIPISLFAFLSLTCLANHIVFAEATYLRAHKQEPFMVLSLISGLTTAGLAFFLVPTLGVAGAVYAYTFTSLLVGLIGGTIIFIIKRKKMRAIFLLNTSKNLGSQL